MDASMPLRP